MHFEKTDLRSSSDRQTFKNRQAYTEILHIWRENECIPPRVGLHHHLHEECEECQGKDTVSGVQHAAKGPAGRPTHTAQPQVHTAADLREDREQDARQSACLDASSLTHTLLCIKQKKGKEEKRGETCDVKMYDGNAGEILSATCLYI